MIQGSWEEKQALSTPVDNQVSRQFDFSVDDAKQKNSVKLGVWGLMEGERVHVYNNASASSLFLPHPPSFPPPHPSRQLWV